MLQGLFEGCLHVNCALQNDESNADTSVLPACKGVVLFCDENDTAIQLLITGNIRRLVRSRLSCDDVSAVSRRTDIAGIVRRVLYLSCHNDFRTALRHVQIARQVYPDSWREVVSLPSIWFVRINTADKWPNFMSTTRGAGVQRAGPKTRVGSVSCARSPKESTTSTSRMTCRSRSRTAEG